jgi:hypothetical protein
VWSDPCDREWEHPDTGRTAATAADDAWYEANCEACGQRVRDDGSEYGACGCPA